MGDLTPRRIETDPERDPEALVCNGCGEGDIEIRVYRKPSECSEEELQGALAGHKRTRCVPCGHVTTPYPRGRVDEARYRHKAAKEAHEASEEVEGCRGKGRLF